jgi:uncharacterized protein YebE (UPF0316 family)
MVASIVGVYSWVLLPLFIFSARVFDVSLQTMRVIFVAKGFKHVAPLIGFFEILVWILAIGQIMQNLTNPILYIAYAGGFALGTFVGMVLENKVAVGKVGIRIITRKDAGILVNLLRNEHVGVTVVDADGPHGPVKIIYSIICRQDIHRVVEDIKRFNPHAFYTIEDVRFVTEKEGIFPTHCPWYKKNPLDPISTHTSETVEKIIDVKSHITHKVLHHNTKKRNH